MLPVFYLDHNSVILAVNKGVANATMFEALPMTLDGIHTFLSLIYVCTAGKLKESNSFSVRGLKQWVKFQETAGFSVGLRVLLG